MHPHRPLSLCITALVLVCGSGAAVADGDPVAAAPASVIDPATTRPQVAPVPGFAGGHSSMATTSNFAGSGPVGIERLAALRGGDDTIESNTSVDGGVHDNIADRVVSGSNSISDDAFSRASGLNTVIQNSGSNVLIQNGMSIQVIFVNPGQ